MTGLRILLCRIGEFLRPRKYRDLDNEIDGHLEEAIENYVRQGLSPGQARREAFLALGGVQLTKERYRDVHGFVTIENLLYDFVLALRALVRRPLFLAAAVTSIAIGVGINVAVYTVLRQVLWSSNWIVASDEDRLVTISPGLSYLNFQDLRRDESSVDLVVFTMSRLIWHSPELSAVVPAHVVSDNFFEVMGTRALRGQVFATPARGEADDSHRVLLSYNFWQRLGGGDSVVGESVTINSQPYTIAGVLPPDFHLAAGPMLSAALFVPVDTTVAAALERREASYFDVLGRLRPGVTVAQAVSSLHRKAEALKSAFPEQNHGFAEHLHVRSGAISPVQLLMTGAREGRLVVALATTAYAMVGLVLLIACANVAALLTARADERRHETAVRTALGASRSRLIQQFLSESFVIAVLGCGAAGLLWELAAMLLPRLPLVVAAGLEVVPGPMPFFYGTALTIIVTVACGLLPAVMSSHVAPRDGLNARRVGHIVRGLRLQNVLVGGQVAFSLVLVAAAFVLIHSFVLLRAVSPGYDITHTGLVEIQVAANESVADADFKTAVEGLSGVESVSYGALPLGILPRSATIHTPRSPDGSGLPIELHPSGGSFLSTLRIPIVRGRDLNEEDLTAKSGSTSGIVVNEAFAGRYVAGDPIGQEIVLDRNTEYGRPDRRLRVVGVARNTRMRSLADDSIPVVYLAMPSRSVVVRMRDVADGHMLRLERALNERFPGSVVTTTAMSARVATSLLPWRVAAGLLTIFGVVGLALAMIGLHGIVSYGVTRRAFEIGVRIALGETRGSIVRLILRDATRVVAMGAAAGALASLAVLQGLRPLLATGQSPIDPFALVGVGLALIAAGAAACFLPARHAATTNPSVTLRSE